MSAYKAVGRRYAREDGVDKAKGTFKYFGDYSFPNALHGKVLRAKYPHANIKEIDIDEALKAPGVVDVITYRDVPGFNGFGIAGDDQPVFCEEKVRFLGDVVALIVAHTEEQAVAAMPLVKVNYEILETLSDIERAMSDDAPMIHASGNILSSYQYTKGDVESKFSKEFVVVRNVYETPYQEHAYLETEVAIGAPTSTGGVEIWCPAQYGYRDQQQLVRILNLPPEQIIIHSSPLGGAFGGKDDMGLQPLVAVAALKLQKTVKIHLSREESFLFSTKRVPFKIEMITSADHTGKLLAHSVKAFCDVGPFTGISLAVFNYGLENCCGVYKFDNIKVEGHSVFTNNCRTGAFRGFGNNQFNFGVESQVDEIATILKMDRLEFRKMNLFATDEPLNYEHEHGGNEGLHVAAEMLENCELWKNRDLFKGEAKEPWLKRGVGIAFSQHGNGLGNNLPDEGLSEIELFEDGSFAIKVGLEEMGQGVNSTLLAIASERLMIEQNDIRIITADTSRAPDTGSTTASRATYIGGNAVLSAIDEFFQRLSDYYKGKMLPIELVENGLRINAEVMTWQAIYKVIPSTLRKAMGKTIMPISNRKEKIGLHYIHSHVVQVTGVEVNLLTGMTKVLKTEILPSAGTVINRMGYEGQVEGGVVQIIGFTLMEDYQMNQDTSPLTSNFQTYLIPTVKDMPEMNVIPVEVAEPTGPYGAKGLGEPVTIPVAPSITNAIYDAVGIRIRRLPATAEHILFEMERRNVCLSSAPAHSSSFTQK